MSITDPFSNGGDPAFFASGTEKIKAAARGLGFDACGIASVASEQDDGFNAWIDAGMHADMSWMERTREVRQRISLFLPGARSVVMLAANYFTDPPDKPEDTLRGRVSRYAWGRDYHRAMQRAVGKVAEVVDQVFPGSRSRISIDSAPVRERAWAARAGIGWVAKNSLIIIPGVGSWCFLAAVVTTAEIQPDPPVPDRCGSCRACMDACPTGAIVAPRVVDSSRCVAYHTIENRGAIPPEVARFMGDMVFGCDICQEVCPWNRRAPRSHIRDFLPRSEDTAWPPLAPLLAGSRDWFEAVFTGTPVRRAKLEGMRRNAEIVRNNLCGGASDLP
ncbi:MAG TPA: tRNA epoxyqueuosine(34) reductase QueG [Candidatus Hydrogenedentes bacterium]|nr:tRNA epoxyqueuosine(34) reductase QueG [Candidatus Hydrogenedentota bacterium]